MIQEDVMQRSLELAKLVVEDEEYVTEFAGMLADFVTEAQQGYKQHSDALFALAEHYGFSPVSSQAPSEYLRQLIDKGMK